MENSKEEKKNIIKLIQTKEFLKAEKKVNLLLEKDPCSTELHNLLALYMLNKIKMIKQ